MRPIPLTFVIVFFAAALAPAAAQAQNIASNRTAGAQPPGGTQPAPAETSSIWEELKPSGIVLYQRLSVDDLFIESDLGTTRQLRNGTLLNTLFTDNTPFAQQDFIYNFDAEMLAALGELEVPLGGGFSLVGQGGAYFGDVDLSYLNLETDQETSYTGSGWVGWNTGARFKWGPGGAGGRLTDGFFVDGGFEFREFNYADLTRTPSRIVNNAVVSSAFYTLDDYSSLETEVLAGFRRELRGRLFLFTAGGGYMSAEAHLEQEIGIDFGQQVPGATSTASLETNVTKTGAFGTVGGELQIAGPFFVVVEGMFGAQSGVSAGVKYQINR